MRRLFRLFALAEAGAAGGIFEAALVEGGVEEARPGVSGEETSEAVVKSSWRLGGSVVTRVGVFEKPPPNEEGVEGDSSMTGINSVGKF